MGGILGAQLELRMLCHRSLRRENSFFQGLFGLDRAISFQTADVSKMRGVRVHFCNGDIWRELPQAPSSLVGGKLIPTRMNDPMYLKPQLWQAALLPGSIAVGTKCNRFFGGVMSCHRSQPAVVSESPLEFYYWNFVHRWVIGCKLRQLSKQTCKLITKSWLRVFRAVGCLTL